MVEAFPFDTALRYLIRDEVTRHLSIQVYRILQGVPPADLAVEQPPPGYVLNLEAARAIAFSFPQSLLERAERVVE